MPSRERGRTPSGFRTQLLQVLRNEAVGTGTSAQRLQQCIAFERLLARLPHDGEWLLKGGFALQLRYGLNARSTKDIDLRVSGDMWLALDQLRHTVAVSSQTDHFSFEFGDVVREMEGAPGGSLRVRVVALVAGMQFAAFHLDISSGDAVVEAPEMLSGSTLLQFAGIAPVNFPVYPVAQHLAEKLHAYTLPRFQENTRVKDLVDLVIIAGTQMIEANHLLSSVKATFETRGTHPIPSRLPEPPESWEQPFAKIADETPRILPTDLREGHALATEFWHPLLGGNAGGLTWMPDRRRWGQADAPRPS